MANTKKPGMPKAPSKKTAAIDFLYDRVVAKHPAGARLIATNDDVVWAIQQRNSNFIGSEKRKLSDKNAANFLKDVIRKPSANANWPKRLKDLKITARQLYGEERVLEFVPYREGDSLPFPDRYEPAAGIPIAQIEALSLSRAARDLGRADEAWLIQVVVYQRIAHYHFAVFSPQEVVELSHLQMSVKSQPEIDAVFLAVSEDKGIDAYSLVTCEAKRYGERILEDQIREQVGQAMSATKKIKPPRPIGAIIPIALKVVTFEAATSEKKRGIYLVEFKKITRESFEKNYKDDIYSMPLEVAASSIFDLRPDVQGISHTASAWPKTTDANEESEGEDDDT